MLQNAAFRIFLIAFTILRSALSAVQCNIGWKMFSSESGNAICAPLNSHFNCIESCEWNTSCTLTSHYAAFRGRRTYVAGMVLTPTTFIVHCCASLGTIIQMNAQRESKCVWVPPIDTVEEKGSIRFDPPLAPNEYIRDIDADRLGKGRVRMRVQICKFVTQRANCTRETMTPEDANFHTLLLRRLAQTKEILQNIGKSGDNRNVSTPQDGQFRDQTPLTLSPGARARVQSSIIKTAPFLATQEQIQNAAASKNSIGMTVMGDTIGAESESDTGVIANMDNDNTADNGLIFNNPTGSTGQAAQPVLQFLSDSVSISHNENIPAHRDQTQPYDASRRDIFGSSNRNNGAVTLPRQHTLRLPKFVRQISNSESNEVTSAYSHPKVLNDDPMSSSSADSIGQSFALSQPLRASTSTQNIWQQNSRPSSLRDLAHTHDVVPTSYYRRLLNRRYQLEHGLPLSDNVYDNRTVVYPQRFIGGPNTRMSRRTPDIDNDDELSLKSEHQTQKVLLINEAIRSLQKSALERVFPLKTNRKLSHIPSYSALSTEASKAIASPSNALSPLSLPFSNLSMSVIRRPFTSPSRQRQFQIQKLRRERQKFINSQGRSRFSEEQAGQQQQQSRQTQQRALPNYRENSRLDEDRKSAAALSGLLTCCQEQAPGCKHLCSKDVSKEEIKHALVSQQCPPLSMTSVIQCFPRYYNITPVTQCCKASAQTPPIHELSGSVLQTHAKLPDQCMGLCAPDFRLSFSHFACIDHISTIVECYRDLLQ